MFLGCSGFQIRLKQSAKGRKMCEDKLIHRVNMAAVQVATQALLRSQRWYVQSQVNSHNVVQRTPLHSCLLQTWVCLSRKTESCRGDCDQLWILSATAIAKNALIILWSALIAGSGSSMAKLCSNLAHHRSDCNFLQTSSCPARRCDYKAAWSCRPQLWKEV